MGFLTWGGSTPTMEEGGVPATLADTRTIYSKDVGGRTELFVKDSAGTEVQMTSAGAIVGPSIAGGDDDIQVKSGSNFAAPGPEINAAKQINADAGTAALPGIVFGGDTDTGIASSGANGLSVSTAGVAQTFWIAGGNNRLQNLGQIELQPNAGGNGPEIWFDNTGQDFVKFMPWNGSAANDRSLTVGDAFIGLHMDRAGGTTQGRGEVTGWNKKVGQVATSDATVTTPGGLQITLEDNAVYLFEGTVVGRDAAGVERCFYKFSTGAHRQGGGSATLTALSWSVSSETDAGLNATFDVTGNDIRCRVTGKAGVSMQWCASIDWIGTKANA